MIGSVRVVLAQTPEELVQARRIRYEVMVAEEGWHIDGASRERGIVDASDAVSNVLLALDGDVPAGTLTTTPISAITPALVDLMCIPPSTRFLRRDQMVLCHKAAVRKPYRNRNTFLRLVWTAFAKLPPGMRVLFLNCETRMAPLYRRLGFVPYGRPFIFPGSASEAIMLSMRVTPSDILNGENRTSS